MSQKFVGNLYFLIIINLLVKPFYIFFIDLQIQNISGNEAYGEYFSLLNASMLFYILLDLGLTEFNRRKVAQNPNFIRSSFGSFFILKLLLSGFYFIVIYLMGIVNSYSSDQMNILFLLGLNQVLISGILFFRGILGGLHLFKLDSIMSVLDKLILIGIGSVLIYSVFFQPFNIIYFVYSQNIAYGLTFIVLLMVVLIYIKSFGMNLSSKRMLKIIKGSLPYASIAFLGMLYYRLDAVMIEALLPETEGNKQAGIYAQSYRLLEASQSFIFLFTTILLPLFARFLKKREDVSELVRQSFKMILGVTLSLSILAVFYRNEIMLWLYKETVYSGQVFAVLLPSILFISCVYIFGTLLAAGAKLKELNILVFFGALINIVMNILLIPKYGALGAAWATLVTQSMLGVSHVFVGAKRYNIKMSKAYWFTIFTFIALSGSMVGLIHQLNKSVIGLMISIGVLALLSILLKMTPLNGIKFLIQSKKNV